MCKISCFGLFGGDKFFDLPKRMFRPGSRRFGVMEKAAPVTAQRGKTGRMTGQYSCELMRIGGASFNLDSGAKSSAIPYQRFGQIRQELYLHIALLLSAHHTRYGLVTKPQYLADVANNVSHPLAIPECQPAGTLTGLPVIAIRLILSGLSPYRGRGGLGIECRNAFDQQAGKKLRSRA